MRELSEFELMQLTGQRAMSEEEIATAGRRDAHLAANYKPGPDDYRRMQNANPYREGWGQELEPSPPPLTRRAKLKRWMFGT